MQATQLNETRLIVGSIVTPAVAATLLYVIVQSALRKELLGHYKVVFMLLIQLYVNVAGMLYEYMFFYLKNHI